MKIPVSKRKKALFIVDVQPAFLNKRNRYVVKNITRLIKKVKYDLYVEAIFHAEKGSLWERQIKWTLPKTKRCATVPEIKVLLQGKKSVYVEKSTRSVFFGVVDVKKLLKQQGIQEVHIVGLQTNSCVLTSALDAFDLGFFTYVIEECSESSSLRKHEVGVEVLREQNLTNNSCVEHVRFTVL